MSNIDTSAKAIYVALNSFVWGYAGQYQEQAKLVDLLRALAAEKEAMARQEPVGYRCKDYGDSWSYFDHKGIAEIYQKKTDCLIQAVFTSPQLAAPNAEAMPDGLRNAINALVHQIDINDFADSNGHSLKNFKALHDLMRALAAE